MCLAQLERSGAGDRVPQHSPRSLGGEPLHIALDSEEGLLRVERLLGGVTLEAK
jgi:hypothetical protein